MSQKEKNHNFKLPVRFRGAFKFYVVVLHADRLGPNYTTWEIRGH